MNLLRCYKAEFIKQRHTVFYWFHMGIPLLFLMGIKILASSRHFLTDVQMTVFLWQATSLSIPIVMPLISSIICGMVAEREGISSKYQTILTNSSGRFTVMLAQLCMMLTMCVLSLAITFTGVLFLFPESNMDMAGYFPFIKQGILICLTMPAIYSIHLFLAYRVGIGMGCVFGFVGVILSALADTIMLDSIWIALPYCWPLRLVKQIPKEGVESYQGILAAVMTLLVIMLVFVWFGRWESREIVE